MDYRQIGSLKVSVVGVGCNNFGRTLDAGGTKEVVDAALDAGINFFDTANTYGLGQSEEYLGKALGKRRDQVIVASKFGMKMSEEERGAHPDYIRRAVQESLKRLGTDWIDYYQLHTPDETVQVADTLGALDELVQAGLVREIGCSNFSVAQLQEAEAAVRTGAARFTGVQNHYNLLHREPEEDGVLDWCAAHDTAFIPFFPLHNGVLTGKYRAGREQPEDSRLTGTPRGSRLLTDSTLQLVEELIGYCQARDRELLELAFGWLLARDEVASVIAGATKVEQIQANAAAAGWLPTAAEQAEIRAILERYGA